MSWEVSQYIWRNRRYIHPANWRAGAKALYRRWSGSGILFSDDDLGMSSMHPVKKISCILELVKPQSVLDVGCGTGQALMDFAERGLDARGVEGSRRAIMRAACPERIWQHDLRRPLHLYRCFDLVWCFEVAEHIHPRYVDVFVDNLVRHSRVIAMSAAPPGQGGEGHFNEQPQHYWEGLFSNRGYLLHKNWTAVIQEVDEFYSKNMMVFWQLTTAMSNESKRRFPENTFGLSQRLRCGSGCKLYKTRRILEDI